MSYARARLANRAAPHLQGGMSASMTDALKETLLAAGLEEDTAETVAPILAIVPEFVPGVGGAVAADNTQRAIQEERYGDAALEAGLGLFGEAFPVVGDIAKWAILAPAAKRFGGESVESMEEAALSTLNGPQLKPNAIKKVEDNPYGGKVLEQMREGNFENVMDEWVDVSTYPVIKPQELADTVVMPIKGDPTAVGELKQYMGIPLDEAVEFDGGVGFGAQNFDELAWASMFDTADSVVDKVRKVHEASGGKRVLGVYSRMGDRSADFNTMPLTLAGNLFRQLGDDVSPELFDKVEAIGETMKGYPGIMSPDFNAWLSTTSAENRKALLLPFMDAKVARESGIFGPDLLRATLDPNLRNDPIRSMGQLVVELDPNASGAVRGVNHNTYDGGIPSLKGGLFGRLETPVSPESLLGSYYTDILKMREKSGNLIPPERAFNTLAGSKPDGAGKSQGYAVMEEKIIKGLLGL